MKHTLKHISLVLALVLASSPGLMAAKAAAATEANGATVEAAVGKVSAKAPKGAYKNARLGQILTVGASVRTGAGSKASLRMADGNLVRLAPNSELLIKAATKAEGSFLKLAKGMCRFLVAKVKPGQSFKVETTNAVAAVKGTDAETESGSEGQPDEFRVYESGNENALEVTDEESGKSQSIGEGEELHYDGSEFHEEEIDQADREQSNEGFEGLPEPVVEQGPGNEGGEQGDQGQAGSDQGQAGQGEGTSQASGEGEGSTESELAEAIEDVLEEMGEDLALDSQLDSDLRNSDLATGKVMYDRFGHITQVENYIYRPAANSVQKEAYAFRDSGEHQGLSFASEYTEFNLALPDDWGTVYSRALNHPDNLDAAMGNYPIYYRTGQNFIAGNPYGDMLEIDTTFQAPSWPMSNVGDPAYLQQGWGQHAWAYSYDSGWVDKGSFEMLANWSDETNHVAFGGLGQACLECTNETFSKTPAATADGGWAIEYRRTNDNTSVFTQSIHLIDDNGQVLDLGNLANASNPSDFRGLPDNVNLEVNFSAPEFSGRSIDLVFVPAFFDAFDFYTLPDGYVPYFFAP